MLVSALQVRADARLSVFTLGYGSEHDGDCLNGLAAAGNGLFYIVENEDSVPANFCVASQIRSQWNTLMCSAWHANTCVCVCVCVSVCVCVCVCSACVSACIHVCVCLCVRV